MMIRVFLLLLVSASLMVRASEPINVKYFDASATVTQPHVTAELIPEAHFILPASGHFDVILHLHSDPGWHTYWINPGDAGLATTIKWTLPEGFTAGPIQWPTPEKHKMGPLVTYGYEGDVYLITTITFPKEFTGDFQIKAKASWLVCQEECIPGRAEFELNLSNSSSFAGNPGSNTALFDAARMRLPVLNHLWQVTGLYKGNNLELTFQERISAPIFGQNVYFFPEQSNVLSAVEMSPKGLGNDFTWPFTLQQNGEKPDHLSGVLVSDSIITGANAKSVYIAPFPVTSEIAADVPSGGAAPPSVDPATTGVPALSGSPQATGGSQPATETATAPPLGTAAATSGSDSVARWSTATEGTQAAAQPILIAVLGAAFMGGLILNLMPCVLPVLSLKVFSLMKHAGDDPRGAWKQGAAFTAGVVISFWILAGLLLFLRAAGNQLGWGFQMQSPGFVLALIFIFFLLGLNLFGVFELGTSLVGLDAKVTGRSHGLTSSFLNGALATLAATPCTAPFMGSALGFAAQQPALVSLLIFTFLAMGMATPYLLLTIFPHALKFVPKPGAWMEAFKQFMGFLLMATVIFLLYVFGALVGEEEIPWALALLLLAGLAAWIYGLWSNPMQTPLCRGLGITIAFLILFLTGIMGLVLASTPPPSKSTFTYYATESDRSRYWQPWSQDAVQKALAQGKPVFVDFTAAWCLSCKVNERVALDTDVVKNAFVDKGVMLFKADWTHADPAISEALRKYNRDGVPLYLLYSPKDPTRPQVLPEVLTPGIVTDALGKI
jgi:thiol:disulfide interchange protein DsbD